MAHQFREEKPGDDVGKDKGFKGPLHPVALPLPPRQDLPRRVRRGVAQRVFVFLARGPVPPPHQVPAVGLGFPTIPPPHPRVQHLDLNLPLGRIAQVQRLPGGRRLRRGPPIHAHGRIGGRPAGNLPRAPQPGLRPRRTRVGQIHPLILVDFRHKDLPLGGQRPQKSRLLAVAAVEPHPGKTQAPLAGFPHQCQRQLALAPKNLLVRRDSGGLAAQRIVRPRGG